jgi:hypothetical protein
MMITIMPTSDIPAEDDIQAELKALVACGASEASIDAIQCKLKNLLNALLAQLLQLAPATTTTV